MGYVDGIAAREVRVQFEALLVAPILRPLTESLGQAGDFGVGLFAREIAARLEPRDD
jgi:hypothetical protein